MTGAVRAYKLLANIDKNSVDYIKAYANMPKVEKINPAAKPAAGSTGAVPAGAQTAAVPAGDCKEQLFHAVYAGLKNEGANLTRELLKDNDSMVIVNEVLIPALDKIGEDFEKGTLFLPQLIMAAEPHRLP